MFVFPLCCLMLLITGEGHRKCWFAAARYPGRATLCHTAKPKVGHSLLTEDWCWTREPLWVVCGWGGPWAALLWPEAMSPLTHTQINRKTQCVAQITDSTPSSQPLLLSRKPQALLFHLLSLPCSNLLPHSSSLPSSSPASRTKQLETKQQQEEDYTTSLGI